MFFISIVIFLLAFSVNLKAGEIDDTNLEIALLRSCSELNSTVNVTPESVAGSLYAGILMELFLRE